MNKLVTQIQLIFFLNHTIEKSSFDSLKKSIFFFTIERFGHHISQPQTNLVCEWTREFFFERVENILLCEGFDTMLNFVSFIFTSSSLIAHFINKYNLPTKRFSLSKYRNEKCLDVAHTYKKNRVTEIKPKKKKHNRRQKKKYSTRQIKQKGLLLLFDIWLCRSF